MCSTWCGPTARPLDPMYPLQRMPRIQSLLAAPLLACITLIAAAQGARPPASVRLQYDVDGVISAPYSGSAELLWQRDGNDYTSQLVVRKFGLALQTWTSLGAIGPLGLEPQRFVSKRLGRDAISALFLRPQGTIRFSANTPDAPLDAGAQ